MHFSLSPGPFSSQLAYFRSPLTILLSDIHSYLNYYLPHTFTALPKPAKNQNISFIELIFSSLRIFCISHGPVASVPSSSLNYLPLQHLKRNTMQICNHCIVILSESRYLFCLLLYTALALHTFYFMVTPGFVTFRLFVSLLFLLLLLRSFLLRILFFVGAVSRKAGCPAGVFNLLSSSAARSRSAS